MNPPAFAQEVLSSITFSCTLAQVNGMRHISSLEVTVTNNLKFHHTRLQKSQFGIEL